MLLNMRNPVFSCRMRVVCQVGWPTPLDAPLRAPPAHHHLVREHAGLGHDQHVQRVAQVVVVHDRVIGWVRAPEGYAAAAPLVEEQVAHGEGVLPVHGEVFVLLGPAVEFGVPEFDVGLRGKEAHGVAALGARGGGPKGGILEAVVEAGVGEYACGGVLGGSVEEMGRRGTVPKGNVLRRPVFFSW